MSPAKLRGLAQAEADSSHKADLVTSRMRNLVGRFVMWTCVTVILPSSVAWISTSTVFHVTTSACLN